VDITLRRLLGLKTKCINIIHHQAREMLFAVSISFTSFFDKENVRGEKWGR